MSLINNFNKKTIQISLSVNKVITFLTLSDLLIVSGWGLVGPIFAVFITGQVKGADLASVGLASTIFLLVRSGLQVPIANILDKIRGERDDFLSMMIGSVIMGIVPLLYMAIDNVPQLFLAQAIYGVGSAFSFPAWLALFTRHIDKNKEGWGWSIYRTTVDLSAAAAAAIGGYLAKYLGFDHLFLLVSFFSLTGALMLLKIRPYLKLPKLQK